MIIIIVIFRVYEVSESSLQSLLVVLHNFLSRRERSILEPKTSVTAARKASESGNL